MSAEAMANDARTGSRFPGFGEHEPLDLTDLAATGEAGIVSRLCDGTMDALTETLAAVKNCAHPVRLVGFSRVVDTRTGEILDSFHSVDAPLGVLYRPCGNRRAEVCPACSRTYARDTFAMLRAGMEGGKTVPETVADNPLLFVTLTAPSFGPVHGTRATNGNRTGGRCRPRDRAPRCPHGRPVGCMKIHAADDPANGMPLCWDCYDWDSAVIWQWWAPELWRRATINVRRALANRIGVAEKALGQHAYPQFARVGEFQDRGLIHYHALMRLDGPDGPGSPAPLPGDAYAACVHEAIKAVTLDAPPVDENDRVRTLAWGAQVDIKVVRPGSRSDNPDQELAADQVAGYLAKYATKDANSLLRTGEPVPHLRKLAETCDVLCRRAQRHDPQTPYGLLGKWAHMWGFRGHFSSKSRGYSVTLGRLRRARLRYRRLQAQAQRSGESLDSLDTRELEAQLLAEDDETTLVVGHWAYQGAGWTTPGDEALALAAAARAREHDRWRAQQIKSGAVTSSGG